MALLADEYSCALHYSILFVNYSTLFVLARKSALVIPFLFLRPKALTKVHTFLPGTTAKERKTRFLTEGQTDGQADRQTNGKMEKQANRQTDRQMQ